MHALLKQYSERKRQLRKKSLRCVLLSILLITILLITTGCASFLFGDSKKAYDLLEKASNNYFKYPSSVQITSGEIYDDDLYCCIRAKNGYSRYVYGTYRISSSYGCWDSSSSLCYSNKLDCDVINKALADHYGVSYVSMNSSSSTSANKYSGGLSNMGFFYLIIAIVFLALNGLLASKASDIAQEKGYEKQTWFHMCFWLTPISYIIVAAMPDRISQRDQKTMINLLEMLVDEQKKTLEKVSDITKQTQPCPAPKAPATEAPVPTANTSSVKEPAQKTPDDEKTTSPTLPEQKKSIVQW